MPWASPECAASRIPRLATRSLMRSLAVAAQSYRGFQPWSSVARGRMKPPGWKIWLFLAVDDQRSTRRLLRGTGVITMNLQEWLKSELEYSQDIVHSAVEGALWLPPSQCKPASAKGVRAGGAQFVAAGCCRRVRHSSGSTVGTEAQFVAQRGGVRLRGSLNRLQCRLRAPDTTGCRGDGAGGRAQHQ